MEILAFFVWSTYHIINDKNTVQLVFGRDMVLPAKYVADWRYICQRKKAQIEKDVIHENFN